MDLIDKTDPPSIPLALSPKIDISSNVPPKAKPTLQLEFIDKTEPPSILLTQSPKMEISISVPAKAKPMKALKFKQKKVVSKNPIISAYLDQNVIPYRKKTK